MMFALLPAASFAQEKLTRPYFVTYDHYLEEAGALEINTAFTTGRDHGINTFWANWTEFEYGARRWWTTALYLDSQHTRHEGTLFTGFRIENRFRPFLEEHKINPVIYVEYEHLNEADKTIKEVVGFDGKDDFIEPNSVTREEHEHELETKLILSSQIGQWNLAENFIGEKHLNGGPWEFGYAVGLSRPLAAATGRRCTFCAERFVAGVEAYGGAGVWGTVTFNNTSHYVAPVLLWSLPGETQFRFSPGWGLTDNSLRTIVRFSVSQEIDNIGRLIGKAFGRH